MELDADEAAGLGSRRCPRTSRSPRASRPRTSARSRTPRRPARPPPSRSAERGRRAADGAARAGARGRRLRRPPRDSSSASCSPRQMPSVGRPAAHALAERLVEAALAQARHRARRRPDAREHREVGVGDVRRARRVVAVRAEPPERRDDRATFPAPYSQTATFTRRPSSTGSPRPRSERPRGAHGRRP